ncbi:MAG: hypothetical protein M0R77_01035 [Gammaproteobacteria bacterium]|nr:hypothetical protein [Acholeplasmataceae bacterium]MCK9529140.1 hypothetical protein [Gammaproteobacteria bacterium]
MTNLPYSKEDILTIECKHAVHCPTPKFLKGRTKDDFHLIKEVIHLKDGRRFPNVRLVKNYKRPFYITKEGFRNHKQKKEIEDINKLTRFECTQSELADRLVQSLNLYQYAGQGLRRIFRSPYIYGAEVSSTAIIKHRYFQHMEKVGVSPSPHTVAGLDIETDMETSAILMGTVSFKNEVLHICDRNFLEGISSPEERIHKCFNENCKELIEQRGLKLRVLLVNSPAEVLIEMINQLHIWKPDFCSIWNIDFEFSRFLETIDRYRLNPAEIFSDPSVPGPFKHFWYKVGSRQKKTASGKYMPKDVEEQWHSVITPASFQFVDAMAAYNFNRMGQAKKQSYALSAILDIEETGVQKLDFPYIEVKTEDTGDWHILMQADYKIEYCVYNIVDPIVLEVLDEKTQDLSSTLPIFSQTSDLVNYSSQPKRKIDEWHFEFLEQGKVIGTTSDEMEDPLDKEIFGLEGWIITLQAWTEETGLDFIIELPGFATNIRLYAGD